ncbi:LysR family transcriptional regulator [Vibrio caribbeanicus]|uniref:LysR family transcriptional regulator n=1 Tax=Vibrio caribbeanicus TaxID=701175 RepID=UPI001E5AE70E|nr:LysR family transcriptional regulator [Vibrio caribbeanicus]
MKKQNKKISYVRLSLTSFSGEYRVHTLEQISTFVAVFELGSYSHAAKYLGKSRTTVREHVIAYEDLLGYALFEIEGRKAVPTDKAIQLYQRAKLVEKQNRSLFAQSQTLYETDVHTINICYDVITPLDLIAYIEHQLLSYREDLTVNWLHRTREQALELLIQGTCDIAILPNRGKATAEKEVTWRALGNVEVGFYVGSNSPLLQRKALKLEELMLETQYITENFATFNSNFLSVKLSPKVHTVSNSDLLCELVKFNGWTAMPKRYMTPWVEKGELVEIKLNEVEQSLRFGLNAFFCFGKSDIEEFSLILDWMHDWWDLSSN